MKDHREALAWPVRSHVIYCSRLRGCSRWLATPKVAETIPTASVRPPCGLGDPPQPMQPAQAGHRRPVGEPVLAGQGSANDQARATLSEARARAAKLVADAEIAASGRAERTDGRGEGKPLFLPGHTVLPVHAARIADEDGPSLGKNVSGVPLGAFVLFPKAEGLRVPWDDQLRLLDVKAVYALVEEVAPDALQ